jgi:hypothetical protein
LQLLGTQIQAWSITRGRGKTKIYARKDWKCSSRPYSKGGRHCKVTGKENIEGCQRRSASRTLDGVGIDSNNDKESGELKLPIEYMGCG